MVLSLAANPLGPAETQPRPDEETRAIDHQIQPAAHRDSAQLVSK